MANYKVIKNSLMVMAIFIWMVVTIMLYIFYAGHSCGRCTTNDTIIHHDTITYVQPICKDSIIVRYVTKVLPVDSVVYRDSLVVRDSVAVVIPITQKKYTDSLYTAYISGFNPSLDSLYIYQRERVIRERIKQSRWSVGIQGGYGVTPKGMQPYIGVGISYRLFGR